jgi:hypothetical protein
VRPPIIGWIFKMMWSSVEHLTSVGGGGVRESSVFELGAEYTCHHRPSNLSKEYFQKFVN